MEKNKIKNAIDFYVLANKLKYTMLINDVTISCAEHIYGSMILAIALNSEFNLTDNIAKMLRMIVLEDVVTFNEDGKTKLETLLKGKQYLKELDEYQSLKSNDSFFALRSRELDYKLHNLIKEANDKELSIDGLYEKAKNMGILTPINNEGDIKYKEVFRFYYMNEKLKLKERSGWDSKHWNVNTSRIERISEHVYGTIILALVLDSEFDFNIDIDKVIKMLCIHEQGEILIGDITPFDGINKELKEQIEHKAVVEVIGNLSKKDEMINLIYEFDKCNTNESKFAYYCDKLEADIQSKIYQDNGYHHDLDDQKDNVVFNSPKVEKMVQDGAKTAFDIWYEWDKYIYEENPVLSKTLKYVKDNKLK